MSTNGQAAAGVKVPDTKVARDATQLIRDTTSELVYNHSRRVFMVRQLAGPEPRAQLRPGTALHRGHVP